VRNYRRRILCVEKLHMVADSTLAPPIWLWHAVFIVIGVVLVIVVAIGYALWVSYDIKKTIDKECKEHGH